MVSFGGFVYLHVTQEMLWVTALWLTGVLNQLWENNITPCSCLDLFSASTRAVLFYCGWECEQGVLQRVLISLQVKTTGCEGRLHCLHTDQSKDNIQLPFLPVIPQNGETTLCLLNLALTWLIEKRQESFGCLHLPGDRMIFSEHFQYFQVDFFDSWWVWNTQKMKRTHKANVPIKMGHLWSEGPTIVSI